MKYQSREHTEYWSQTTFFQQLHKLYKHIFHQVASDTNVYREETSAF